MDEYIELQQKLGYHFKNKKLLAAALVHSSYANENKGKNIESNERLEFLGDSVLGMVTAEYLYKTFRGIPEGELTKIRAVLVCETSLAETAAALELGKYLILGRGEISNGGRKRNSINADAVEAILAAIYLDGGKSAVQEVISRLILSKLSAMDKSMTNDYKTLLQEFVQREKDHVLFYNHVGESGPDHNKTFAVEAMLDGRIIGSGKGHSKKEAEQMAAKSGLERLKGLNKNG